MNVRAAVVDASVVVKWLLPEPGRKDALKLAHAAAADQIKLIAPDLLAIEVASALSKRARRRMITETHVAQLWREFERSKPRLLNSENYTERAMQLSIAHHLSFFDCLYLAFALQHRLDLYTADARVLRALAPIYPFVQSVLMH
jgi:predicted nucleic acid-binding protein